MVVKKKSDFESNFDFCDRARIRTWDRLLRRQVLYPAELRDHFNCTQKYKKC